MDMKISLAAETYAKARLAAAAHPQPGVAEETGSFARLAESFVSVLAQGEQTSKAAMTGNADPHALVEALAASQLAVETAVTVRDKVVEAYQEILRMPV